MPEPEVHVTEGFEAPSVTLDVPTKKKKKDKQKLKAPKQKILAKKELADAYVIRMASEIRKLREVETQKRKVANLSVREEKYKELMMERHGVTRKSLERDEYYSSEPEESVDSEAEEAALRLKMKAEEEMKLQQRLAYEAEDAEMDQEEAEAQTAQVENELAELAIEFESAAKDEFVEEPKALSPAEILAKKKADRAARRKKEADEAAATAEAEAKRLEETMKQKPPESKFQRQERKKKEREARNKRKKDRRTKFIADRGIAQAMYYSVMESAEEEVPDPPEASYEECVSIMFHIVNKETRLRSSEKEQILDEKEIHTSMGELGLFMVKDDWPYIKKRFNSVTKPGIPINMWIKVFMSEATPAERVKPTAKRPKGAGNDPTEAQEEEEEDALELEVEAPREQTPEWAKDPLSGKIPSEWIDCDIWDATIDGEVGDPVIHLAATNFYSDPVMTNTGYEFLRPRS